MKKRLLIVSLAAVALLAAGCDQTNNASNSPTNSEQATNDSTQKSQAELTLRQDMRKLWTDHTVWTRDYIIASVDGKPDAQAAATRLLKNQDDIGNAVAAYYGKDAGDKLTALLKQHINIAVDLINAAKVNDQVKFNDANAKWKANGQEIADFLASANPNWPQATMRDMMAKHLATTTDEVTARLNKKYDDDVRAYDAVYDHILMMSDALSDGIIKQFPDKF
jgi:hypothetical protein